MGSHAANWREKLGSRLMTPQQAVALVKNGDRVWVGGWTSVPTTLCGALADRAGAELSGLEVLTFLSPFKWDRPDVLERNRVITAFVGPYDRAAVRAGRIDYFPAGHYRGGKWPAGLDVNIAIMPISPPDDEGFCSFGGGVWFSPGVAAHARTLIGEIHPEFIRTGGNNRIHISRFERVAEAGPPAAPPIPPRSPETELAAQVICTLVAAEIVKDGATLQIGVGDVSTALPLFLGERRDLGIHTEILPGGVLDLMKQGVVTNRYKKVHPSKTVASALVQMPPEELAGIDGHPDIELHDFTYTDDISVLTRLDNLLAINNALAVDLTGNVCAEAVGSQIFSGPGGQIVFASAASFTNNGSVIVLPSSQLVEDIRHTRIVAAHPAGSTITVHRTYVDYVVTEQGIARLTGKTIRERIGEMIAVAHPDFRAELRAQARQLYGVG
jgi:4-hydroxybutyrate CoA-transferase